MFASICHRVTVRQSRFIYDTPRSQGDTCIQISSKRQPSLTMAAPTQDLVSFPIVCDGYPELIFDLAGADDVQLLTEFIMKEFFHRFPLKDNWDVEKELRPWIGQYISHVCSKGVSIILRDTNNNNRIAAAAINDIDYKNRPEDDISLVSFADPIERPGWQNICDLLEILHEGMNLDGDPVLSIDMMTVGQDYAKRGLSTQCTKLTVMLAKCKGLQSIKVEAVSEFMAHVLVKGGFQMIKEIDYNRLEINGKMPFATEDIHRYARLYILKIAD
ncbi:hypothetical protein OUZ56_019559 [Daphnia magna]|uniref:N-acetyltransferase domain-containing protein n=1 Tax=Daphnia magna TaxID=35525 RepID=A0ABQ9ZBX9_9CRUS|nr:hypothetical protein OUZ56_019559 [Daphnia magna]